LAKTAGKGGGVCSGVPPVCSLTVKVATCNVQLAATATVTAKGGKCRPGSEAEILRKSTCKTKNNLRLKM